MHATVADFREECEAIAALMDGQPPDTQDELFERPTLFKQWTVGDIFKHLHVWNIAAHLSLTDAEGFAAFLSDALPQVAEHGHVGFQRAYFAGLSGAEVYAAWGDFLQNIYSDFAEADPEVRVAWAGPP